jgi:midasin (ATPase involved in ribosome maturation)
MQRGDWVILDNVEQANQAILARLYPIMEKSIKRDAGSRELLITEYHHQQDDTTTKIKIDPNFRLFLLWDNTKSNLENLSLFNRCLIIDLQQSINNNQEQFKNDLIRQSESAGVRDPKIQLQMINLTLNTFSNIEYKPF